jgi:hypothetical protein
LAELDRRLTQQRDSDSEQKDSLKSKGDIYQTLKDISDTMHRQEKDIREINQLSDLMP